MKAGNAILPLYVILPKKKNCIKKFHGKSDLETSPRPFSDQFSKNPP